MNRWIHRARRSLSARLVIVILAAGLLNNYVVFISLAHFRHRYAGAYHRVLTHYIATVAQLMGDPPSHQQASAIAEATGFVIEYRSGARIWSTRTAETDLPPENEFHLGRVNERTAIGFHRGHILLRYRLDTGELIFTLPRTEKIERAIHLSMALVLAALTAIVAGAYLLILRFLRPLRRMHRGVEAVQSGRLDYRVAPEGAVEFRDLADSFNAMTGRVRQMLNSKERLLLDVSHELRSPIARMKLSLAMMPEDEKTSSLREDLLEMEQMVTSLLEAARLQHGADSLKRSAVSLAALIREVILPYEKRPPGVKLPERAELFISLDADKMRTVLRNLVENGIKYSRAESGPVTVAWQEEGESVAITVRDQGIGISEENLKRIFEPFFRADDSRSRTTGGFGLGLSLCKAIVEAHGGTIEITSACPGGTEVRILLPNTTD
jgi:signal transduction histidine kinase